MNQRLISEIGRTQRLDIINSLKRTKGMSVTAARMLMDRLAPYIKSVLVLHDFDVSPEFSHRRPSLLRASNAAVPM